jgi:hypothetical protein
MDLMNITTTTSATANNGCPQTYNYESYNLKLRIISVFVLLIASSLGATISVVSTRVKFLHINPIIINTGKFFGTG